MSAMQIKGSKEGTSHRQEDLEQGKKMTEDHWKLYKAAFKGDWKTAQEIYKSDPNKANDEITNRGETALHIAALAGRTHFVKELVKWMNEEGLLHKAKKGDTAFHFAVMTGKVKLTKAIMEKKVDFEIPLVFPSGESLLGRAAGLGHREMVGLLYEANKDKLSDEDRKDLLAPLIEGNMYDIALDMLKEHPAVAAAGLEGSESSEDPQDNPRDGTNATGNEKPKKTPLLALAKKRYTIRKDAHQGWAKYTCKLDKKRTEVFQCIWKEIVLRDMESRLDDFHFKPIFLAAEQGNVEFLTRLVNDYPDILLKKDENGRTIIHVAVLNRHIKIFNLIHQFGSEVKNLITTYIDTDGNNMLHLAGMLPPSRRLVVVPATAIRLRQELIWFQRVKKVVKPWLTEAKNKKGVTPRDLFEIEHEDMRKKAEKWVTRTANSCTLVGTLIATVVFPVIFTVPDDIEQDTGTPISLGNASIQVFLQLDAAALIFSFCSVVTFLSILTSRFRLDDFLHSLHWRLIFGWLFLVYSMAAMMITFGVGFSVVSYQGGSIIWNSIWLFIPVLLFSLFHFRLLRDLR